MQQIKVGSTTEAGNIISFLLPTTTSKFYLLLNTLECSLEVFIFIFLLLWATSASAGRVILDKSINEFPEDALGGIRTIVRYEVPAPNRHDIAIIFLASPNRNGGLPTKVQVLDDANQEQQLTESEGPDCTLRRVALFHDGSATAAVVATRFVDLASFTQAEPGPMQIQVYQLQPDGDASHSTTVFKASGAPARSKPVCTADDVDAAIDATANSWRSTAVRQ